MLMELRWWSPNPQSSVLALGIAFSEMPHFMCKAEYPKSSSSWIFWSMHHFLASVSLIMFQSEFSCLQVPLQNLSQWQNGRTVTCRHELCTCPKFHSDMEHLFSNKMPGFMGETVLQLTCLPVRAAAGNLMPENRQARSSPEKLSAAFPEHGVWRLHQKYTQTSSFQQGCKPSLPSLPNMCLDGRVMPCSSSYPFLSCSSVFPAILILSAKGVKPRVPCVSAE